MNDNQPSFFTQLLAILNTEELIRLERRFQLNDNAVMAIVIHDEIQEREQRESTL